MLTPKRKMPMLKEKELNDPKNVSTEKSWKT